MTSTAFLTDYYELTQLQAALESGRAHEDATFELFARKLPEGRRYGVVGGTERAIKAVLDFRFTEDQLTYLTNSNKLKPETIAYLRNYKFDGEIFGYREGDLYFPYSPILTVKGSFGDSVLLETLLLSILNHDSAVASAASRMVVAAEGTPLIEMGSRRTHDIAAVDSARVAYLVGFNASSNIEAGYRYGVPITGTSAHAFTLLHSEEIEAFQAQIAALGVDTTLLVDTYDIEQGIRNAVAAAQEVGQAGPGAIRIDSGDLHDEPLKARQLLDSLGATATRIVVSSDIDEYSIAELMERGTPVDGVGAGTRVVTGSGHPTAGMVFKLVEREGADGQPIPVAKKSTSKKSVGGLKTVYRSHKDGEITGEYYTLNGEALANEDQAVQVSFMEKGEVVYLPSLEDSRVFHAEMLNTLPHSAKLMTAGEAAFEAHTEGV